MEEKSCLGINMTQTFPARGLLMSRHTSKVAGCSVHTAATPPSTELAQPAKLDCLLLPFVTITEKAGQLN